MIKTIKNKSRLFSQPPSKPKYYISVKSRSGKVFHLADPRITRLSIALMDMQAGLGGAASHWGGPSAFSEICSALFGIIFHQAHLKRSQWYEMFHVINDAGHCENGIYALKANYGMGDLSFKSLKTFRSLNSRLTGHGEAHLFPEGIYLSNGPLGSTVAQAQGLCMADKMENRDRKTIVLISDGACMEGEVKEALTSIAGFAQKKKMNPFIAVVSDNNTKLSGRIDEDSFSMDSFFQSVEPLGWDYRELSLAHDLRSCVNILEDLLNLSVDEFLKPVFIRARTIKGYGVKYTEEASHGGHGFPLKDPEKLPDFLKEIYGNKDIPEEFIQWCDELRSYEVVKKKSSQVSFDQSQKGTKSVSLLKHTESFPSSVKKIKVQEGISKALIQAKEKKGLPILSVSSDLQGSTGVLAFRKKFPECAFDLGVAEANMISVAAGLSKQGFIPVVDTFAQFGVTKGALPLFMANLSEAPVIAIFSHTGFQDAADGASHQTLTYLAQTLSLPLTRVFCLTSSEEAFALVSQALETFTLDRQKGITPYTYIFFLGREVSPPSYLPKDYSYELGKAQVIYSHNVPSAKQGVSLMACGPLLEEALQAARKLVDKSWNVEVINPSLINDLDMDTVVSSLQRTQFRLLTVEDHHLTGGMGSVVAHHLMLRGMAVSLSSLAVLSPFGRSAYKALDLYKRENLDSSSIVQHVLNKWNG